MAEDQSFNDYLYIERSSALTGNRNISLLAEFGVMLATTYILLRSFDWQPVLTWAIAAELASLYSWYSHQDAGRLLGRELEQAKLNNIVFGTWLVATLGGWCRYFSLIAKTSHRLFS